jgi:hypothetical protein
LPFPTKAPFDSAVVAADAADVLVDAFFGNGKMVACDKLPVEPGRAVAADLSFEVEGGDRADVRTCNSLKIITL